MIKVDLDALNATLDALPKRYPGPGGVAGVMHEGKVIATRAWGYANLDTAQPMASGTRLPICSISKQFTCQVLLAEVGDPSKLDNKIKQFLPQFTDPLPSVKQLCDNQSGLRDYWALTVLQGANAEQEFKREDALPLVARMKTGHFAPGTQYSYCNCNFRILSELIEGETGEALEALYRKHIWDPARMETAILTSDTSRPEDGVIGYEGSDATGFFPAENAIFWIGDAGISASLSDMLAYEHWIDATRKNATSLYRQAATPPTFNDGTPAAYGYGLAHENIAGTHCTGHGGALRGFRAQRLNACDARLSVIVMFNHEADAHGAAQNLMQTALAFFPQAKQPLADDWDGQWIGPDGLLARIDSRRHSAVLRYATTPDTVTQAAGGTLTAPGVKLARSDGTLLMTRVGDNMSAALAPLPEIDSADGSEISGNYYSEEMDARMQIDARGGGIFVRFSGMLGTGRMERAAPAGKDVWTVVIRRSMDAPAPGDWTLMVKRDDAGNVTGLTMGCWLARKLTYWRYLVGHEQRAQATI